MRYIIRSEKGLVPVNLQTICIKSQANKDYTIQLSLKSWKGKVRNSKSNIGKMSFFLEGEVILNGQHESNVFKVIRRFTLPECNVDGNLFQTGIIYGLYQEDNVTTYPREKIL